MRSPITTHILDTAQGHPAAGVYVTLEFQSPDDGWQSIGVGTTDSDGRIDDLLSVDKALERGTYRLVFDTGTYHASTGRKTLHPRVTILFSVDDEDQHYHIPLLLSPFGYSTYRGS